MFKLDQPFKFILKPEKAKIFERGPRLSSTGSPKKTQSPKNDSHRTCTSSASKISRTVNLNIDLSDLRNFKFSKSFREKLEQTETMLQSEKNELQATKRELYSYRSTLADR